jgi:Protein of unknown function (DUF2889)
VTARYRNNDLFAEFADDLEPLHQREYIVRAYRRGDTLVLRGVVRDQKPAGLYITDDDEPLTIHHMVVELDVSFPALAIAAARVRFIDHPHLTCPAIVVAYERLVGLSIARGFTHKVRELFGGPRGCTHTTALLQAMAPVAVQSMWSMTATTTKSVGAVESSPRVDSSDVVDLANDQRWKFTINTCHIWDADGEQVTRLRAGGALDAPLTVLKRLEALGRDSAGWSEVIGTKPPTNRVLHNP